MSVTIKPKRPRIEPKRSKVIANPPAETVLSTTTPAGVAALDPLAKPPSRALDKVDGPLNRPPIAMLGRRKRKQWESDGNPRYRVVIDPEFRALCRPLSESEFEGLTANVAAHGCLQPLVTWWDGEGLILIDGHNRWQICKLLDEYCDVVRLEFETREHAKRWVLEHQAGRRNLSPAERDAMLARAYRAELTARSQTPRSAAGKPVEKAAAKVAREHGVSAATVKRAAKADRDRKSVASAAGEEVPLSRAEASRRARGEGRESKSPPAEDRPAGEIKSELRLIRKQVRKIIHEYLCFPGCASADLALARGDILASELGVWRRRHGQGKPR